VEVIASFVGVLTLQLLFGNTFEVIICVSGEIDVESWFVVSSECSVVAGITVLLQQSVQWSAALYFRTIVKNMKVDCKV
jgi:hypothetical protein